ncbi:hypothetical protein CI109_106126 [Kwoniella shandongensis]|uniref:Mediator of RNA polymerase II transcription subunit 11 n=1 Tax=Kwoniella shandongensis TaxID=1734106 RepID=A0A5M6BZE4_9TREE|nr:uncharacterized protein CI109_003732 [Kwoniella shandongensis]KAA5527761.1 hypothetical protein CI109_003732 [Kwoniella shandongensis]
MASPDPSISDGLELESLDADSLFAALTNVEKAVPELLLCVKPILSHLVSPSSSSGSGSKMDEEQSGISARESVERYMSLLDKIQYVLRQTVYYLRETRSSPQTLRPPPINSIPTPFASTLPRSSGSGEIEHGAELGLYASRIEARTLRDMKDALVALRGTGDNHHHDGTKEQADGLQSDEGEVGLVP